MTAVLVVMALRHDQDWGGFVAVLGILVFAVLYARWETSPVRDWWRQTQARTQQLIDAGFGDPWPNVTTLLAPDPEDLDATRPDDVDVCSVCLGEGAVMEQADPYGDEWDSVECWACGGTGVRSAA